MALVLLKKITIDYFPKDEAQKEKWLNNPTLPR